MYSVGLLAGAEEGNQYYDVYFVFYPLKIRINRCVRGAGRAWSHSRAMAGSHGWSHAAAAGKPRPYIGSRDPNSYSNPRIRIVSLHIWAILFRVTKYSVTLLELMNSSG